MCSLGRSSPGWCDQNLHQNTCSVTRPGTIAIQSTIMMSEDNYKKTSDLTNMKNSENIVSPSMLDQLLEDLRQMLEARLAADLNAVLSSCKVDRRVLSPVKESHLWWSFNFYIYTIWDKTTKKIVFLNSLRAVWILLFGGIEIYLINLVWNLTFHYFSKVHM